MVFTLRWTADSLQKINKMIRNIDKAETFGDNRMDLTKGMRDDQADAWMQDFPRDGAKRYGGLSGLASRTIQNRVAQDFPAGPPLVRSGNMMQDVEAQSRRGVYSHNGVFWSFRDKFGSPDRSIVPVHQNQWRTFWDLQEDKDLSVHESRVDAWLGQLGRIILHG